MSAKFKRIPNKIIPNRNSFLLENEIPTCHEFCTLNIARQLIPNIMAITNCPNIEKKGNMAIYFATKAIRSVNNIPFKKFGLSVDFTLFCLLTMMFTSFSLVDYYFNKACTISKIHIYNYYY